MGINTGKVVVGGIVAGIVNNVLGFLLFGMWLQPRFTSEINAVAAGLADKGNTSSAMAGTIISGFVLGLTATWLYAAIRPRFGPGMKTAVIAALVICVFGFIFHLDLLYFGLTSPTTYMLATVAAIIQSLGTAIAGAMLYKEEGAVAAAMA
jgi:hypothetical protein